MSEQFRQLPIDQVTECSTNPRRHFDQEELAELAQTIRTSGLIEPLVVRPQGEAYELVAGARRLRACKLAELSEVPVIIRDYSDQQVLEVQLIENLQRKGVTVFEEGEGYRRMRDELGYDVAAIAEKIGRKRRYVYQRMALVDVIPDVRLAVEKQEITANHAILISRLPHKGLQQQALEHAGGRGVGRFHQECSIRGLDQWIKRTLLLKLKAAPFDRNDAELLPAAGSCTACPKRSGNARDLYSELSSPDICTDRSCYDSKVSAHVKRELERHKQAGQDLLQIKSGYSYYGEKVPKHVLENDKYRLIEKKADRCDSVAEAIVAVGSDRGVLREVCIDPRCKKHHGQHGSSSGYGRSSGPVDYWAERAKNLPHNIKIASRRAVLVAVLAKPLKWEIPRDQLQVVARALLPFSTPKELLEAFRFPHAMDKLKNGSAVSKHLEELIDAPEKSPAGGYLSRIVLGLALQGVAKDYCGPSDEKRLHAAAEALGIDHKKIAADTDKSMRDDFNRRRAKAQEKQKAAAKLKPKAAEPTAAGKRRIAAAGRALEA